MSKRKNKNGNNYGKKSNNNNNNNNDTIGITMAVLSKKPSLSYQDIILEKTSKLELIDIDGITYFGEFSESSSEFVISNALHIQDRTLDIKIDIIDWLKAYNLNNLDNSIISKGAVSPIRRQLKEGERMLMQGQLMLAIHAEKYAVANLKNDALENLK